MSRGCREDHQRGVVDGGGWHRTKSSVRVVIRGGGVRQKDDPVIAKHRVPGRRVAAILGGRPRDDDGIDAVWLRNSVESRRGLIRVGDSSSMLPLTSQPTSCEDPHVTWTRDVTRTHRSPREDVMALQ